MILYLLANSDSLILDFSTISFLEIHTISLSSQTDSEILPQISSAQPFSSGMCFEIACVRFVSEAEIAKKVPNVNRKRVVMRKRHKRLKSRN